LVVYTSCSLAKLVLVVTDRAGELLLVGGDVALDLANTVNGLRDGELDQDFLATPADVAEWAVHAGVVVALPAVDARVHAQVRELRDAVYAVFRAIAEGRDADPAALAVLAELHAAAIARARLVPAGDRYDLAWDGEVLGPLAAAAVDLLRHGPLDQLKLCDGCPWLFLDGSRNQSRRWCAMNECGGRLKMRRYRARKRATARGRSRS
jgi:predicted RNA-binding Zn ribbon-like protein